MKSGRFHEICEIWRISPMKSARFHPWNLVDITLKSSRFHPWNPVDFTQISPVKSTQNYKSKCFSKNSSVWWMQGGGFHPWNPVDFTLKPGGFHLWNLVDFTQISPVKSTQNYKSKCFSKNSSVWWMQGGGFHPEIWWISPRFNLWNPPKIIKASVSAKTLQFDECRVGAMTKDFTCEIQQSSPRFHLWNPPKIIKASVSSKTLQFDECRVGAMTKDFIKSTRFHPEIRWISPMKSGRFHPDFTHEIWQISPRFDLWNPPKIIKASVLAKTLQFDECRVGDFTLEIWWILPWNLVDFNHEIWWISPRFHLWNPPKL